MTLTHNMDTNNISISIYLDLITAFNTLSFDMLLAKFIHYDITGTPLKLLTNYLTDRYQYVIYNRETPNMLSIIDNIFGVSHIISHIISYNICIHEAYGKETLNCSVIIT